MALDFDPRGDFQAVADGQRAVTLRDRSGLSRSLEHVLRREISKREMAASSGRYKRGDTRFHLSTTEIATEPELGATIIDDEGTEFVIIEVDRETLSDRWKCYARNLAVAESLNTLIAILRATDDPTRTTAGALRPMWVTEATGVRASIQPMEAVRSVEHDQTVMPERARCVFLYARDIDATRRLQQADGTTWKIERVDNKDRIDALWEAEIIRTPWPLP